MEKDRITGELHTIVTDTTHGRETLTKVLLGYLSELSGDNPDEILVLAVQRINLKQPEKEVA